MAEPAAPHLLIYPADSAEVRSSGHAHDCGAEVQKSRCTVRSSCMDRSAHQKRSTVWAPAHSTGRRSVWEVAAAWHCSTAAVAAWPWCSQLRGRGDNRVRVEVRATPTGGSCYQRGGGVLLQASGAQGRGTGCLLLRALGRLATTAGGRAPTLLWGTCYERSRPVATTIWATCYETLGPVATRIWGTCYKHSGPVATTIQGPCYELLWPAATSI